MLLAGQVDAAWICGYPYVRHRDDLALLAVPIWRGWSLYQSYLIGRPTGSEASLADLRGEIHAFSDPDSNSGYLVTTAALAEMDRAAGDLLRAQLLHLRPPQRGARRGERARAVGQRRRLCLGGPDRRRAHAAGGDASDRAVGLARVSLRSPACGTRPTARACVLSPTRSRGWTRPRAGARCWHCCSSTGSNPPSPASSTASPRWREQWASADEGAPPGALAAADGQGAAARGRPDGRPRRDRLRARTVAARRSAGAPAARAGDALFRRAFGGCSPGRAPQRRLGSLRRPRPRHAPRRALSRPG